MCPSVGQGVAGGGERGPGAAWTASPPCCNWTLKGRHTSGHTGQNMKSKRRSRGCKLYSNDRQLRGSTTDSLLVPEMQLFIDCSPPIHSDVVAENGNRPFKTPSPRTAHGSIFIRRGVCSLIMMLPRRENQPGQCTAWIWWIWVGQFRPSHPQSRMDPGQENERLLTLPE